MKRRTQIDFRSERVSLFAAGATLLAVCVVVLATLSGCTGDPLSYLRQKVEDDRAHQLLSFSFPAEANPALSQPAEGLIAGDTVTLVVPVHTNVTSLVAAFDFLGSEVLVGETPQLSGATPNDFGDPVVYRVAAADETYRDYTVTVREATDNADLASLTVTRIPAGDYVPVLEPAFDAGVATYIYWVPNAVDSLGVTAVPVDPAATARIGAADATAGVSVPLVEGPNTITVTVTAEDTSIVQSYVVEAYRAVSVMYTGAIRNVDAGEDGQTRLGYDWDPATRYLDNGDGTITDLLTGLTWLRDWDALANANWETALDNIDDIEDGLYGLADGSAPGDWRMPNVFELFTLVCAESTAPGNWLQSFGFLNMDGQYDYLSSTTVKGSTDIFTVDFDNGFMSTYGKTQGTYRNVIAVRGLQSDGLIRTQKSGQVQTYRALKLDDDGALEEGVSWPSPRFIDQGNGTILDRLTGFLWVKNWDILPSTGQWGEALTGVAALEDDGILLTDGSENGDWRLPNAREISTLINYDYLGLNTWLESQGFQNIPASGAVRTSTARGASADMSFALHVTNQRLGAIGISIQGRYTGVREVE